jgi:cyclophilin family peptidyl-prolyl cis-trans isomerase
LAAEYLTRWTGRPRTAAPRLLLKPPLKWSEIQALRGARLRVTMAVSSGSGRFEIALFPDEAPATVARVVRLARAGYYNGLTFHRVVPNFVIQGGSPNANEYTGDALFMRDEVGPVSHNRGTLGISTRGRDTGDAQIFVNLVDNPRLDFNYTVWGRVVSGMEVVDGVLEGDVIERVEVVK